MLRTSFFTHSSRRAALLLLSSTAFGQNLIQNGGFESPFTPTIATLGAGSAALAPWTVVSGQVDVTTSIPNSGRQLLDISGFVPGAIEQTFSTVVGQGYRLSFYITGATPSAPAIKRVEVSIAGQVQTFTYDTTASPSPVWQLRELSFTASATSTTLRFTSVQNESSPHGAYLDDVSVVPLSHVNLIQNGSFEFGTPGNFLVLNAGSNAIAPWEITAGGIDVTNGSPPIGPQHGARNIDLDGFYLAGTIAQNFAAQSGKSYLLSFYMSANPGGAVVKQIEVTVGNKTQVFSYDWSGGVAWVRCELPFQALSNTERLVVKSLSVADSAFGACLDNFVVEELSCEAECDMLQQALGDALAALAQANASVTSLTQQLSAANADKLALQQQLAQANADKTVLQTQLAAANSNVATLQQQLAAAQGQIAQITSENAALQQQLLAASADKLALQQQLAQANADNVALQAQLTAANASVTSLQQQLAAAQGQVAQLTADKAALQQQLVASQAQVASLQTANAGLTQQLAAAQATITSLQGSLIAITASLNRVQEDFRAQFNNPSFVLPGANLEQKVDNLATAIIDLSHGRAIGIYDSLR